MARSATWPATRTGSPASRSRATELPAIVSYRYGAAMAGSENVRMLPVPVELPSFQLRQHWHERYHGDAPGDDAAPAPVLTRPS
jgi:hypothetical protein